MHFLFNYDKMIITIKKGGKHMNHNDFLKDVVMPIMDKAFTLTDKDYNPQQFRHTIFNQFNEAIAYSLLDTLWSTMVNQNAVDVMCEKCFNMLSKLFSDYTTLIKIARRTNDLFKLHIYKQEFLVISYIDIHLHSWYNVYRNLQKPYIREEI